MKKIVSIIGARPQFIKVAALVREIHGKFRHIIIHTGQHYDDNMSDVFFRELSIPYPDYNLEVGAGTHGVQTGMMLLRLEPLLQKLHPDMVITYGDTNSTLAAALCAKKLHFAVTHVEAGLRSFNKKMAEELNRISVDHISDILCAPTVTAVNNLLKEGIPSERIIQTGDIMYDIALFYKKNSDETILNKIGVQKKGYILFTMHRAENTDVNHRLRSIMAAITEFAKDFSVVWPIHPRAKKMLQEADLYKRVSCLVNIIDPVGYKTMLELENSAQMIITDSGGVQKEAYFYNVPCLVLRDSTEWTELIDFKYNTLVPDLTSEKIVRTFQKILKNDLFNDMSESRPMFYGDGNAAVTIIDSIEKFLE
ncbi:non-hydrolyzing UDP-N-acetylglucosamine 2-epimerase [Coxiella burnetii]|uniref:non-hydrolyzing UDP-N-acetylglucosamine 2-epimerase n=1 Tax=Coxiella burnetii TaxID=777 RepID=UPI000183CDB6|nr:UDP-N-acetylglucosamine 2-epimerase (non-hydrolyzing) [Coxiella burnetii]ACJ18493.1 UDP-N-acetylglucosamine 2-epimerase [Coxiella burnetii CbuG_Q212]ATN66875.1 UDP-N-acetyl glucosamine 2-epimerase [Coxiella burnetii]OYK86198.1 UDP-N-acetylglucosamine 2-epimerase (non-hydrolyzing) [Coxiella burnetii]